MTARRNAAEREVTIVYKSLPHYRVELYERLRRRLADDGVRLRVVVGQPDAEMAERRDTMELDWAEGVRNRYLRIGRRQLIWQPVLRRLRGSDLVIVEQASKLLVNYPLLAWRRLGGPKVAWWGHGINLDRDAASHLGEGVKRRLASRADWWFCYTEGTRRILADFGVRRGRTTVVQNAVDTLRTREARASLSDAEVAAVRDELGIGGGAVGLWLSSIYPTKRPEFMVEAADHLRSFVPDFELIVIGDGPLRQVFDAAAQQRMWIHVLGVRTSDELVRLASPATVLLNPGLVGLTVLDAFALGIPMVTCDLPYHSPEVEYLEPGVNGLVLPESTSPAEFAHEVATLLDDTDRLKVMSRAALDASGRYTLDEMVERFANGIVQALAAPSTSSTRRSAPELANGGTVIGGDKG